jgi:eukaryotic-like serine/threonine-protein kinase
VLPLRDLKPGYTLGRYEMLMPVAQGGMAAVWAARLVGSRGFQKVVAIKTMLPDLSEDEDFEAMFLDEARLASRIKHPYVAEIIDLGEEGELIYLVMEWVSGDTMFTLNKLAKAKGGIPLPLLLRIASAASAGLHAAHELRDDKGELLHLVHRDVSPQNVMISEGGIVKIVDFGVAKAAGRTHETRVAGLMKGKVPYLSPEQLDGRKVDRRSDIFSLGILMYVMVSGRHPFRGETDHKTMENICTRAPVPLRELVTGMRPDLEAVVMKALEKDPADRWVSGAEVQRALDGVLNAMNAAVTDGDVAAFVRETLGDILRDRNRRLADAIRAADNRLGPEPTRKSSSAIKAGRGGAPLPATFGGILPVSLDDVPLPPRPVSDAPERGPVPSQRPTSLMVPPADPRRRRRRRGFPGRYFLLLLVLVLGAGAALTRTGYLPEVASRLPPWLQILSPDPRP